MSIEVNLRLGCFTLDGEASLQGEARRQPHSKALDHSMLQELVPKFYLWCCYGVHTARLRCDYGVTTV